MRQDSGRTAAIARKIRHSKSGPSIKYKRITPEHPNRVLQWVAENRPEYALIGGLMPEALLSALKKRNLNHTTYKRILLNETIVTLDELYHLAAVFNCKAKELI